MRVRPTCPGRRQMAALPGVLFAGAWRRIRIFSPLQWTGRAPAAFLPVRAAVSIAVSMEEIVGQVWNGPWELNFERTLLPDSLAAQISSWLGQMPESLSLSMEAPLGGRSQRWPRVQSRSMSPTRAG